MRKENSTNFINEKYLTNQCGMAYMLSVVGGRWKLSILGFLLQHENLRFGELKRKLKGISEKVLITQLKELQVDGLVQREAYPEVPPKVEYSLTPLGLSLEDILMAMSRWGEENMPEDEK